MRTPIRVIQALVALGIYNVWLVRPGRATPFRGGGAKTLRKEFAAYGLPPWFMRSVGALKLGSATALLAGLRRPALTRPAALALAALMAGAVSMHLKVRDPPRRSLPALTMLLLSLVVAAGAGSEGITAALEGRAPRPRLGRLRRAISPEARTPSAARDGARATASP